MGLHAAHVVMFSALLALRVTTRQPTGLDWDCGLGRLVRAALGSTQDDRYSDGVRGDLPDPGESAGDPADERDDGCDRHGPDRDGRTAIYCVGSFDDCGIHGVCRHHFYRRGGAGQRPDRDRTRSETVKQVGILGAGLGTATQGRYYLGIQTSRSQRGWQEDGVSRLFMEFGLPGVLMLGMAGMLMIKVLYDSLKLVPATSTVQALQIGMLSCVMGNAASFAISHQQYSGDPVSALMVTIMAGIVLGAPRILCAAAGRGASQIRAEAGAG